jgi:hypothetical protein
VSEVDDRLDLVAGEARDAGVHTALVLARGGEGSPRPSC